MSFWLACGASVALAGPQIEWRMPALPEASEVIIVVRADGSITMENYLIDDQQLEATVRQGLASGRTTIVVNAEDGAPYYRVAFALDISGRTNAPVALVTPEAPIGNVVSGHDEPEPEHATEEVVSTTGPWRKQTIDPYNFKDFTAYTEPHGQLRVGAAYVRYGLFPNVHLATVPALDVFGVINGEVKAKLVDTKRFDLAVSGSLFYVPVASILKKLDKDGKYKFGKTKFKDKDLFVRSLNYSAISAKASGQVTNKLSVHGGLTYSTARGKGQFDFGDLPIFVTPDGNALGGDITIVSRVVGELYQFNLAADYQFNRRDALMVSYAGAFYGKAKGAASASIAGLPEELDNFELTLSYGLFFPPSAAYRFNGAYQATFKKWEFRVGWGMSSIPLGWYLSTFDVAYKLGGVRIRGKKSAK